MPVCPASSRAGGLSLERLIGASAAPACRPSVFTGDVGGEARASSSTWRREEVAEEAEPGQHRQDGRQIDLDGAGEVRGRGGLRRHLERPAHRGGNGHEVEEVHPARRPSTSPPTSGPPGGTVVLDDQVAADRLDVDHAAPLLVGEHPRAVVAPAQAWSSGFGEPEDQACARGQSRRGSFTDEQGRGMINVESIGGHLIVQHYRRVRADRPSVRDVLARKQGVSLPSPPRPRGGEMDA